MKGIPFWVERLTLDPCQGALHIVWMTGELLEKLQTRIAALDAERLSLVAEMKALGFTPAGHAVPSNHGKGWSAQEKAEVAERFRQGMLPKEIAALHRRTTGSIRSELIKQGLMTIETPVDMTQLAPLPPPPRPHVAAPASFGKTKITPEFQRTFELLENTQTNVFLTGKAGTGKSTFLHYFREHTKKKIAVVAPTGVAALNVQGQTIHSFFQLKPGFIDVRNLKPSRRRVFRQLELLIIDEISMVRADVFAAIDVTLRHARKNNEPFGGVQVCVIGDLFQLPPVVQNEEKALYTQFYRSPFFFCTEAYKAANFTTVQFNTIHRQNDGAFIQILNAIRAGTCDTIELEALNTRLSPRAAPAPGTLVLTTTNALAEDINTQKLARLPGISRSYEGRLMDDFGMQGTRLPAPQQLVLKVGAQVMFVKNDSTSRWVNGTIGTVEKLEKDIITVRVGEVTHEVTPEAWTSIAYKVDKEADVIIEEELGSYTQFPLMLAWAVTIHKSQGKTLERVIIDLGTGAFAPGQLYVALSRCKSLSGIALKQPVSPSDIRCDPEVVAFMGGK